MKNRIVRLTVNNFLRVQAVDITPGDVALVLVGGANDQGKSSVLNAIATALSGKDVPAVPIHKGAAKGSIILETEEFTIEKKFSGTGGVQLEIRDKAGAKLTSPQAKLDALCTRITFDPFQFTKLDDKAQLSTLKQVAGLDFTDLDNEYRTKFDVRTGKNREVKTQEGKLAGITRHPLAPIEEESITALAKELEDALAKNRANDAAREELSGCNDDCDKDAAEVAKAEAAVKDLEAKLEEAKAAVIAARQVHKDTEELRDITKAEVAALQDVDTGAIRIRMQNVETANTQVRENAKHKEEQTLLFALHRETEALTKRLEEITEYKKTQLQNAKLPVAGIGFDEDGLTYDGLPFSQAATSVKIRTSFAIARQLNPGLPVMLIRDGSLLDEDALAMVRAEAEEHGCQVWIEIVTKSAEACNVLIEDGLVSNANAEPVAKKKAIKTKTEESK